MTLSEAIETVLELQKRWSARKTPDMDTRASLIEHTIPELLTGAAKTDGFNVEGGAGAGFNNRVAWVRVFRPDFSPTPTEGWYAVFLFAGDGSAVFLSLNQGTTDWMKGRSARKDSKTLSARRDAARSCLIGLERSLDGLLTQIELHDPGDLGKGYEYGNVFALKYAQGSIPPDETLHSDLSRVLGLLKDLYLGDIEEA